MAAVACVRKGMHMVGRTDEGVLREGAPAPLLERVIDFLAKERAQLRHDLDTAHLGALAPCAAALSSSV